MTVPVWRRLVIGFGTTALAAMLFRPQIADALVTRGDDFFRAGKPGDAARYYGRALALDANAVAAERLSLMFLERNGPGDASRALAVCDAGLVRHPGDVPLRVDRALAEERLRQWHAARRDFEIVANATTDWRYEHFAARMAQRDGDRAAAIAHLRRAVALGPHNGPSRIALGELLR